MSTINNPKYNLAVDKLYGINNANLYFFSWGGLAYSVILAGSYYKNNYSLNSKLTTTLFGVAVTSFIAMVNASNIYQDAYCKDTNKGTRYCDKTEFALILGACCGVFALLVAPLSHVIIQALGSLLLLAAWSVGVAFTTFKDGPGTKIGNLYFSTWLSQLLSLSATASAVRLLLHSKSPTSDGNQTADHAAQVEAPTAMKMEEDAADEIAGVSKETADPKMEEAAIDVKLEAKVPVKGPELEAKDPEKGEGK